jgi:hypothetical protein
MIRKDLIRLAVRLAQRPVPTLQKKVYGYQGDINTLLDGLPPSITVQTRVTDVCQRNSLPSQEDKIRAYLYERVARHLRDLQGGRHTSVIVIQEAELLVRYHVPLAFLYDLTGDAHAIILHLESGPHLRKWKFPSYVHYNPEAAATYFVQALGGQFIREDQAEE